MNGTRTVGSGGDRSLVRCGPGSRASELAAWYGLNLLPRRLLVSLATAAAIALCTQMLLPEAALTAPAAQETTPGAGPGATPTMTADERFQERQLDKLTFEIRVLQQQEETLRQERVIGEWRAIANTLAEFGQLAIGLGVLVVLARGLERWLSRDDKLMGRYVDDDREVERGV